MFENYHINRLNIRIIIYALALSTIGVMLIYSATNRTTFYADYYKRQIMGIAIGIVCMLVMILINYKFILKMWPFIYAFNAALLILTLTNGSVHGGAKRWLVIPVIGSIQPSDFTKLFMVICLSALIGVFFGRFGEIKTWFYVMLMVAPVIFLILKQPDLSTTILLTAMVVVMLYVAKISYKIIAGVALFILPFAGYFIFFLVSHTKEELIAIASEQYQLKRVLSFIWPDLFQDSIYQQHNSVMAIGSGGLLGKGLNTTTFESVKNGNFISESHTDFIFTIAGEETGFVGCVIIIILLLLIVAEVMLIAKNADTPAGRSICVGFATMYAMQTFINIAVATWMMPNTGLPLPFISYGLSSIISMYISIGIVLNIGLQRPQKKKNDIIDI